MRRGDIYLVTLDPTEGHEQQGTRPVLVVSPDEFNRVTQVPVVLPITSGGNFARTAGFAVSLSGAAHAPQGWCVAISLAPWICGRGPADAWKMFRPPSWKKFSHGWQLFLVRRKVVFSRGIVIGLPHA